MAPRKLIGLNPLGSDAATGLTRADTDVIDGGPAFGLVILRHIGFELLFVGPCEGGTATHFHKGAAVIVTEERPLALNLRSVRLDFSAQTLSK